MYIQWIEANLLRESEHLYGKPSLLCWFSYMYIYSKAGNMAQLPWFALYMHVYCLRTYIQYKYGNTYGVIPAHTPRGVR